MSDSDQTVYIVSGLPRSGTSMMMQMLEAGGLQIVTDNIRTADDDNLQGYFEFERIKQLKEGDSAWMGQACGKVLKVISALLEHLPDHYHYKIIFMERDLSEVLASQRKMLERRGKPANKEDDVMFSNLYKKHLIKVKAWLSGKTNFEVIYIGYKDLMENPKRYSEDIARFIDAPLDVQKMANVPQERFYRQRSSSS
jgi:hypothetical protein